MFENIEVPAGAVETAEAEIARIMAGNGNRRFDALLTWSHSLAAVIAEDAVLGGTQWQPRLDQYVYLERQIAAAMNLPGLAEHTEAACDTITRAAR